MSINQRIKKMREELGMSQNEFGEKIGVTRQMVGRYETDFHEIPAKVIIKIINNFPHINSNWITNGMGEMIINNNKKAINKGNGYIIQSDDSMVNESPLIKLDSARKEIELLNRSYF